MELQNMSKESVKAINEAILSNIDSIDELREVQAAIKIRIDELNRRAKLQFRVGSKVKFFSPKYQKHVSGTIQKINPSSIKLVTELGSVWKVSPSLLESA